MAKAIKNETELEGIRRAHLRDAAALVSYFAWLEDELLQKGNTSISEADGADKLEEFRAQQHDFVGLSFDTISSTGPNGAIIHYKPERGQCDIIRPGFLLRRAPIAVPESARLTGAVLVSRSDGTTDVTRTLHFGRPTDFERQAFTRVLQGHIALDSCVFPRGTTGYNLDPVARIALWKAGLDYRHGTGHGVGAFLNVHEGPHGIGTRIAFNDIQLQEGMTVTNEPGYYDDGNFGVRLENIMLVVETQTPNNFGGRGYLRFEHVTHVPIAQRKMLDTSILSAEEIQWIDNYHRECLEKVGPLLKDGSPAKKWLERECLPVAQE
ncbi:MAG: peptidase M24, structural domain-containing protein [Olpidium bornovanus]|uniref:Peptidase M24, structural domain-containing protein n=1 Tax=Olpidium bornovanus TaxID=278681 RepID=A0A8H8DHH2_9FUNG|nr:MAG: peptidase M24, structural domain-containing protein [Olpidium bornovanus]